ncbi:MAG: recombinase family protein [Eubacteriales bacterium]|nr:recombinase family protein [Eubacteriales bacterium]
MKKKKCYIYTRVSTMVQTEGYSLDAPKEKLRRYAEYKNLEITGEYCDAGKSGKSIKGRPAFQQMMEDVASQKDDVSYVLVFKLSRFGRNAADVLKSLQLLLDYEVNLVSVDDAIDSSTQGGPIPYGYRKEEDGLVQYPSEAEIVKLIFDMYLQDGMLATTIVWYLNDNGFTRMVKGKVSPFKYDFVTTVLDNPVYCGKIFYNRRTNSKEQKKQNRDVMEIQGSREPILSVEQWEQVQQKRKANSVRHKKVDEPDRVSILSGLVKCPVCGAGMIASKNKHINKNHGGYYKILHYYSCENARKQNGMTCKFRHTYNQYKVDNAVLEMIGKLFTVPSFKKETGRDSG